MTGVARVRGRRRCTARLPLRFLNVRNGAGGTRTLATARAVTPAAPTPGATRIGPRGTRRVRRVSTSSRAAAPKCGRPNPLRGVGLRTRRTSQRAHRPTTIPSSGARRSAATHRGASRSAKACDASFRTRHGFEVRDGAPAVLPMRSVRARAQRREIALGVHHDARHPMLARPPALRARGCGAVRARHRERGVGASVPLEVAVAALDHHLARQIADAASHRPRQPEQTCSPRSRTK